MEKMFMILPALHSPLPYRKQHLYTTLKVRLPAPKVTQWVQGQDQDSGKSSRYKDSSE